MTTLTGALFHRQSSGLVREGRALDAVFFNFFGATFGPVIGWVLLFGIPFYPGASPLWTVTIAFACCLGVNVAYALFSAIMPRSGGDYVFISRTFHPALGFVANASFMFWLCFYSGTGGALFGQLGLAPAFRVLGQATGNVRWEHWGDWFNTGWGKFVMGLALIVLTGPILIFSRRGLRSYFRFQKWVFAFCAATLIATIVAMLVMSHDAFIHSFDGYTSDFAGSPDSYQKVLTEGGPAPASSGYQTLLAATWPFYGASFLIQSAYWAGEHKKGVRAHLTGMTLAFVIAFAVMWITVLVALKAFSLDFLNALGLTDPAKYGMSSTPYFAELTGAWTGPVVAVVIVLGLGAWFLTYVGFITIMVTRSMLAWSFDGIMPDWLGRVDKRTSNPINAILVTFAFSIFFLALYSFTTAFSVVTALLGFAITFLITSLAAIVFPYRRRDIFEASPASRRLLGIPILSIAGVFGTAGMITMIVVFLRDPSSGTNWPLNKNQVLGIVAALVVPLVVYGAVALFRRRQGVDLGMAYQALPPE